MNWYKLIKWIDRHILGSWEVIDEDGWDLCNGYEGYTDYRKRGFKVTVGINDNPLTEVLTLEFKTKKRLITLTGAKDPAFWNPVGITTKLLPTVGRREDFNE